MVVFSMSFSNLKKLIQTPIEKKFLKGFYNTQKIITQLSSELLGHLDREDIIKTISDKLTQELETKPNTILLKLEEDYVLFTQPPRKSVRSIDFPERMQKYFKTVSTGMFYKELPLEIKQWLMNFGITSQSLLFPMMTQKNLYGLFILGEKLTGQPYNETDQDLARSLIHQIIVLFESIEITQTLQTQVQSQTQELEEKRKIEKDLKIAGEIQKRVLPNKVPQIENYTFSASFYPARMVSGDYYDFLVFSDTEIGIVIADIVGKGIPAAFQMMTLKTIIHQTLSPTDSPKEALEKLNKEIGKDQVIEKYVPLIYGKLNTQTQTQTFTYTNAGHEPGIYARSKDPETPYYLTVGGAPVGFDDDEVYEEETLHLHPGDQLVLFTDGLLDVRNDQNEEWGRDGVLHMLPKGHDALVNAWQTFKSAHHPQKDDMTMVSIKF